MATSPIFSGNSRYAADFQAIIDRAVSIASLPITQLASDRTQLTQKQTAYQTLNSKVSSIRGALNSLGSALGVGSFNTHSSDDTVATATVGSQATSGSYSINVTDEGAYSRMMSRDSLPEVSDPSASSISAASSFVLTVDGVSTTVTPAGTGLDALASAINSSQSGVYANLINIGPSSSPDYRLSLQATSLGSVSVQLNDGTDDLVDTLVTGRLASYTVNGQPSTPIESDSRTVTVAPGLTVTLIKSGNTEVTVSRNTTALGAALTALVSNYNAAVAELDTHRGQGTGALKGDSQIFSLGNSLRQLVNYTVSSSDTTVTSLADLGISFANDGTLSFDSSALLNLSLEDIQNFLGSEENPGFLDAAQNVLSGLDQDSGILPASLTSLANQITQTDARIAENTNRITLLQETLNARMAAADALIASLEQQATYFTNLFATMQDNANRNG